MNILEYFCIFSLFVFKSFCSTDRWNNFLAKKFSGPSYSNNAHITNKSNRKAPTDTDCRFWDGLSQPVKQKNSPSWYSQGGPQVLYYWNQAQNTCLPCTRCHKQNMVTYVPCSFYRDTQCISDDKWHKLYKNKQSLFMDEEDDTNGENLYGSIKNDNIHGKRAKGPQIFGETVYTTNSAKNKANYRQIVMNKTGHFMNKRIFANPVNAFGKPYFYATDPKDKNAVFRKKQEPKNPINDVVREFLNNNVTGKVTVKDIIIPKATNQREDVSHYDETLKENANRNVVDDAIDNTDSMYYTDSEERSFSTDKSEVQDIDDLDDRYIEDRDDINNDKYEEDKEDINNNKKYSEERRVGNNVFEGSRKDTELDSTEEPQTKKPIHFKKTKSWRNNGEHASIDIYRNNDNDNDIYRNNGEHASIDIYSSDKTQFERPIRKYQESKNFPAKKQSSGEFGVEHDDIEQTNKKESSGDEAFSQIFHMLEEVDDKLDDSLLSESGPHKKSRHSSPYLLEQMLMIVTIIVVALLVFLLIVLARNKYRASRFKLLDNADGVDSYQSMTSPFERSDSTTTQLTGSPSRSVLELDHNPSAAANNVNNVPQAVARSLKNINPVNEHKVAKTKVAAVYVDERGRTKLK